MNKTTIVVALITLALGLGLGFVLFHESSDTASTTSTVANRQPLFYRNPMNPAVTSPVAAS